MAKRFVRSQLWNTWNGKTPDQKAAYNDSIVFTEDRKLIYEHGVEFDGRKSTAGEGIAISELAKDGSEFLGQIEIAHGLPLAGSALTLTTGSLLTPAHSGTFDVVTGITKDKFGHITGATKQTVKLPASGNVTSKLVVSNSATGMSSATTATTNTTTYLNHVEGSSVNADIQVKGAGNVKVTAVNDVITITGTDSGNDNTTYAFTGGTNQFTVTPSTNGTAGTALTVTVTPSATISAGATDDDVVVLTGTPGTNGVSYDAKHAKTNVSYTSGVTGDTISGYGDTGTIKIPKITVNAYGHVTGITDQSVTITMPSELSLSNYKTKLTAVSSPSASGNATAFIDTISQDANGKITVTKKNITAADLGLTNALKFKGVVATLPTSYSGYVVGDVILCNAKEYVLSAKTSDTVGTWTELGDEGSHALKTIEIKGTGVLSGGGTLEANRNITHNEVLGTAITTAKGGVSGNTITVPTIKADKYGHLTEVGTATWTYTAPTIPNSFGKVKVGTTEVVADTTTDTLTLEAGTNITITPDATNDKITISSSDTTYSAGNGLTLSGTTFNVGAGTGISVAADTVGLTNTGVTAASYGPSSNASPSHSGTFSVPYFTVDAQGRITAASTKTITLPASGDTHHQAKNIIANSASGTSETASNLTNGNVYLNLVENGTKRSSHKIQGVNGTIVTYNASTDTMEIDWEWEELA